jgi:hypothetical protein
MRDAAHAASDATDRTMQKYRNRGVTDEDDITGVLIGQLDSAFQDNVGGLKWKTSILRHRSGSAAEEKEVGADMLIHVELDTPTQKYSKGVLIQAKRQERDELMSSKEHADLIRQCNQMLGRTPDAFVFDYTKTGMRCGSAIRIAGSTERGVYEQCSWTPYRFFLELFRCPIGDRRIRSHLVEELSIPHGIKITGSGDFGPER